MSEQKQAGEGRKREEQSWCVRDVLVAELSSDWWIEPELIPKNKQQLMVPPAHLPDTRPNGPEEVPRG